jgi:Ca2+-binding RTX toxin-like protein
VLSNMNRASLSLEPLDQRTLPSVTASVQSGFLVLTSDSASDTVVVEDVGDQIKVTVNGQVFGQAPRSMFSGVAFFGNDGDDVFVNASSLLGAAVGGAGNDTLVGLSTSVNLFDGGDGNDILVGGGGDDFLIGGAGDDTLFGGPGRDIVAGNEGRDREFQGHDANDIFDDRGMDPDDDLADDNGGANEVGDDRGGNSGRG